MYITYIYISGYSIRFIFHTYHSDTNVCFTSDTYTIESTRWKLSYKTEVCTITTVCSAVTSL